MAKFDYKTVELAPVYKRLFRSLSLGLICLCLALQCRQVQVYGLQDETSVADV